MERGRQWWISLGLGALAVCASSGAALATAWPRVSPRVAWEAAWGGARPIELEPWLADGGERLDPATMLPRSHQFDAKGLALLGADCGALPAVSGSGFGVWVARWPGFEPVWSMGPEASTGDVRIPEALIDGDYWLAVTRRESRALGPVRVSRLARRGVPFQVRR